MKHVLSMKEMSKEDILHLLELALDFKQKPKTPCLQGKIMASCFFEASTRTQFSFNAAMKRLGGEVIGFSDANTTSMKKGESLYDMMKVMGSYADIIVIRHPERGSAHIAAEACGKSVINAGDGDNEHPTQTLVDLFTIQETQKRLNHLNILIMGDLKYGRTAHSLALACRFFQTRLFFISPEELSMPAFILKDCDNYSFHQNYEEIIDLMDIVYVTRLQEERLKRESERQNYGLSLEGLKNAKKTMKILHALPRNAEIPTAIDNSEHAYYFKQAENGLYLRMAILRKLLCA